MTHLTVDISTPANRTLRDWGFSGPHSAITNARNYAKDHGAAGVVTAIGSFHLIYMEGGSLRQRTWQNCRLRHG